MGKCEGCGKLGRMAPRDEYVDAYHFSLLLCPVVSVWDCIVRKMRKSSSQVNTHRLVVSMDSIACNKVQPVVRKVKKKAVKGEMDRLKQAEKKKRRLEKALATSAAIRSELEKKKQKKKEEQQRLDEEGAAIAEAVALHVLLGEDSDDSCKIVLNKEDGFNPWDCAHKIDFLMGERRGCAPHQDCPTNSIERYGWLSNAYGTGCNWGELENSDWSFSYGSFGRNMSEQCFDDGGWGAPEFPAALVAAQAVSSLQITEDADADTILFNGML
ncbi:hypothetical protein Tsubulata_018370 [Turnera subulata]|uniref:Uncharacterized protein n=1 Tax=Turnera subulata TaxID=218843 RepID=A0A9Q0FMF6_9ROSI|nr:hypothetical protein Tsubulata_018370 [Turnera subulata]